MNRKKLARARFARTSAEGGGGGTGGQQQTGTDSNASGGNVGSSGDSSNSGGTSGPKMVTDEDGTALYPANTAVAEMTAEQRANYWRTESKKHQKKAEQLERDKGSQNGNGSGTVRDQQQSSSDSEAAVTAAREAGRREAARDSVLVTMTATLQSRGKKPDEITELLDVVNPDKFLDDQGKLDGTKVANYVARVAPVQGSTGGGGLPGQGNQDQQGGMSAKDRAKAEAEKRGIHRQDANRGVLGGLSR